MKLLSAVSLKRLIMRRTKTRLASNEANKDVSKKLKQRKASSKDKTKDIRIFFKIAEKKGNDENEQVQEKVTVDITEID